MAETMAAEQSSEIPDPWDLPLDKIDVSQARLFQENKHGEYFRRLRQEDPIHFCPESPFGPYWSITKFKDIVEVDSKAKVFSSAGEVIIGDQPADFKTTSFIASDEPKHSRDRRAVQAAVAPARLSELEDLVRQRAGAILDSLPIGEEFNWVELVSKELTTQMLATLFDFPFEDRHLLPYWSDVFTASPSVGRAGVDMEARQKVIEEAHAYFARLWHERANAPPKFDFISMLAHDPNTKNMINDPLDFLGTLALLIIGGNDTTRNSISGGVVFLNQFPEEYAKLQADPSLIPNMVSEIIRYLTPLAHMRRNALEDYEIGGKTIRKGDKVVMWYVSGNRDEDVIENADAFLIDRERARHHVSFGFGIHRCMGNRVGEMQLRILWEEILKRFEKVELVGEVERVESNFVNGYTNVPVIVHAK